MLLINIGHPELPPKYIILALVPPLSNMPLIHDTCCSNNFSASFSYTDQRVKLNPGLNSMHKPNPNPEFDLKL